jgi:hypothetical protein
MAGNYPGAVSNILETAGFEYLDPINEFANALLSLSIEGLRRGEPIAGDPLFNGRIGDGHFSAQGCEVWAEAVGRRLALLVDLRFAETGRARPGRPYNPYGGPRPGNRAATTLRSP